MEDTAIKTEEDAQAAAKPAKAKKPKKAKKKRRWLRTLVVLVILAAAAFAAKTFLGGQTAAPVSTYQLSEAVRRDLPVSVSGSATLRPADSYQVTALVSGEIREAPFEELSAVQAGDLLYTIDASSAQDRVNTASLTVREQELAYQQALDTRSPKSPLSGIIAEVYVADGAAVNAGDKLLKIVSDTDITADFLYPYVDPSEFWEGQPVTVFVTGYEGTVKGTVASVSDGTALMSNGQKACSVRVKIPNPGALVDGESYTAKAVIGSYTNFGMAKLNMGNSALVYAGGSGRVTGFTKMLGSTVEAGETLCTISSDELDSRIETARLAVQSAQLQVNSARDSMDGYKITAPISGTVIEKKFKAGDKVDGASSGALAEIYDLSCLKMEMEVNELDIGKVAVGQSVTLTAAALPGETFTGVVDKVGIAGKTTNGFTTYPVTINVTEYGELRPGMNVSATIQCDTVKDALCVPVDAVARGNTVLVPGEGALGPDGSVLDETKLESRQVVLGRSDDAYVQITSGLSDGETVAYQATQTDGTAPAASMGG